MLPACLSHAVIEVGSLGVQVAPVVDASSSQSRADVLIIGLSAVLVLTGLQWLSLRPKPLVAVSASLPSTLVKHASA